MDRQELNKLLEKLHTELAGTDAVDEAAREHLRMLMSDIREVLDRPGNEAGRHQSLKDRLDGAILRFENTHPNLTLAMARVTDALTQMGF